MARLALVARIIFLTLCLITLAIGLFAFQLDNVQRANEQRMTAHLLTILVGFPTAFFVTGLLSDFGKSIGIEFFSVSPTVLGFIRDWLVSVILGYVQWFLIVPSISRFIGRAIRRQSADH